MVRKIAFCARLAAVFALAAAALLSGCSDREQDAEYLKERRDLSRAVAQIQDLQIGLLVVKVQPDFVHYADIPRVLESGSVQYLHERNEKLIEIMENDAAGMSAEIDRMSRMLRLQLELDRVAALEWRRQ